MSARRGPLPFCFSKPAGWRLNAPHARTITLPSSRTLVNTPSPVGHEARGQRAWLDYAGQFADETFSDAYGNCVAVLNKGGSPRLMLSGHADEIAMAVNYINEEGFIYVRKMGGVDAAITKAQRVVIHTRKGAVKGVVGNVAPHLMKDEKEPKAPKIHDLFIDIGVGSRKEAEQLVRIGDPITLTDEFELLRNDLAVARAFDNRIGTFAVAETLRLLKESKVKLHAEVCAVSNVQEEVGLLGARQIAYSLKPDIALVVDVTHATDYPTVSKHAARRHPSRPGADDHARRLQPSGSRRAHRGGGQGPQDSAAARGHVLDQRHGHGCRSSGPAAALPAP